jgi:hypothetical protein
MNISSKSKYVIRLKKGNIKLSNAPFGRTPHTLTVTN